MVKVMDQRKDEVISLIKENKGLYSNRHLAERFQVSTSTMSNFIRENNLKGYMKSGVRGVSKKPAKNYIHAAKEKQPKKRTPFKRIRNDVTQYCGAWDDIDIMLDAGNRVIKWVRKMTPDLFTDDADAFVPVVAEVGL